MPSMDTNSLGMFKEVSEDNMNRKNCLHRISGTTGESLSLRVASGVSLKPPIKDGTLDSLLRLEKRVPGHHAAGRFLRSSLLRHEKAWMVSGERYLAADKYLLSIYSTPGTIELELQGDSDRQCLPSRTLHSCESTPRVTHRSHDSDLFTQASLPSYV